MYIQPQGELYTHTCIYSREQCRLLGRTRTTLGAVTTWPKTIAHHPPNFPVFHRGTLASSPAVTGLSDSTRKYRGNIDMLAC